MSLKRRRLAKGLAIVAGVVFLAWMLKLAIVISSGTLVGHILEETRNPMSSQIWGMVDAEATAHFRGSKSE